ncbi:DUF4181 domain-containing protein [Salibacterium qingdaonense]|uniref:Uncharacterized protein n=1 Tax=Salibacterium qingdaonense TaxID=266892 RepID=A0A1I4LJ40_9BACI|nr:DUF4181 domain-containing protein [Salibacterium qingdaonense]SFL90980.1 protein of unknown function [Salibacterium qingdaonense]
MLLPVALIAGIAVLSEFLSYILRRGGIVELPASDPDYVNKRHKYIDKSLYVMVHIVIVLTLTMFPSYRILIFLLPVLHYAYLAVMWHRTRIPGGRRTYLLSVISAVLFLTGAVLYGFFNMG